MLNKPICHDCVCFISFYWLTVFRRSHVKRSTSQKVPKSKCLQVKMSPSQKGFKSKGPSQKVYKNLMLQIKGNRKPIPLDNWFWFTPNFPCRFCGLAGIIFGNIVHLILDNFIFQTRVVIFLADKWYGSYEKMQNL